MQADTLEARVHRAIENSAAEFVPLLQSLVRAPSPTGDEARCQGLVKEAMVDLALFDREVYADDVPPFHPTGRRYDARPNVVGVLPGSGSQDFILNAHVDTAPVEDPSSWTHPPYGGVLADGRLYGRGALDDKAGIVLMLLVADSLRRAGVRPARNLYLQSVIEDEDSGNGTLACTLAGYTAEAGIILDGTWPFRCVDAHLGQLGLVFEITGVAAPACNCRRGRNPLDGVTEILTALRLLVNSLNSETPRWLDIDEPYYVNAGKVQAGVWAGSVPERARLEVQLGFAPPTTIERMLSEITRTVQELACGPHTSVRIAQLCCEPFSNRPNELVGALCRTVERLRAGEREFGNFAVTGHCDLRHLRRPDGGVSHACLYGPGGGGNPHCPNEFYLVDNLIPVAQNVASTIMAWFGLVPGR